MRFTTEQVFVEWKDTQIQPEITESRVNMISDEIESMKKSIQSQHRQFACFTHLITLSALVESLLPVLIFRSLTSDL